MEEEIEEDSMPELIENKSENAKNMTFGDRSEIESEEKKDAEEEEEFDPAVMEYLTKV